MNKSKNYTID